MPEVEVFRLRYVTPGHLVEVAFLEVSTGEPGVLHAPAHQNAVVVIDQVLLSKVNRIYVVHVWVKQVVEVLGRLELGKVADEQIVENGDRVRDSFKERRNLVPCCWRQITISGVFEYVITQSDVVDHVQVEADACL